MEKVITNNVSDERAKAEAAMDSRKGCWIISHCGNRRIRGVAVLS